MTTNSQSGISKWILIISALIAVMELVGSVSMYLSPESILETVVDGSLTYIIYMWATRQFALGFIFAYATWKKSIPMLTVSYIFFLVMFIGDFLIALLYKQNFLMISAMVMSALASGMLYVIYKKKE